MNRFPTIAIIIVSVPFLCFCQSRIENHPSPADYPGTIRVGTYNVENMFDGVDDPHKADGPPTTLTQFEALAEVIISVDCDVLALQEVENIWVLEMFNDRYLGGMYTEVILVEGNDPRGIDVGVLSKLEILDVISFRDREIPDPINNSTIRFSRDVLAVELTGPGGISWMLMTTHLKAGSALEDRDRRTLQAEEIARIIRQGGFVSRMGRGQLVLAGDLNGEPDSGELEIMGDVPFSDPARDIPYRRTHASGKVFDYILLSPDIDRRYVVGSVNIYQEPPAREASDHFLVYLDLRF